MCNDVVLRGSRAEGWFARRYTATSEPPAAAGPPHYNSKRDGERLMLSVPVRVVVAATALLAFGTAGLALPPPTARRRHHLRR